MKMEFIYILCHFLAYIDSITSIQLFKEPLRRIGLGSFHSEFVFVIRYCFSNEFRYSPIHPSVAFGFSLKIQTGQN